MVKQVGQELATVAMVPTFVTGSILTPLPIDGFLINCGVSGATRSGEFSKEMKVFVCSFTKKLRC